LWGGAEKIRSPVTGAQVETYRMDGSRLADANV
jgi:hypothetical protein